MPNPTDMEILLAEHDDTGGVGKKKSFKLWLGYR